MSRKPTVRQQAFAEAIVSGKFRAMSDAYRDVYQSRGSRETVKNAASRLWRSPTVQAAAEAARKRLEASRSRQLAGDRDAVRRKLWGIVDDVDARDSDVIAACRLLGMQQGVGMFEQRVVATEGDSATDAEVIEEIRATLNPYGEKGPGDVSPEEPLDPEVDPEASVH